MNQKARRTLSQVIFRGRFLYLLIYILVLIAIQPLDEAIGGLGFFLDIIITAILISAIYAVSQKTKHTVNGAIHFSVL